MAARPLAVLALAGSLLAASPVPPSLEVGFPKSPVSIGGKGAMAVSWKARGPAAATVLVQTSSDPARGWEDRAARPAEEGQYVLDSEGFPEGVPIRVRLTLRDAKGRDLAQTEAAGAFTLDRTPPEARVEGPERTETAKVEVKVASSDGKGSGVASVQLWVKDAGQPWIPALEWSDPAKPLPWTAPHRGRFGLYATASDRAGNPGEPPGAQADPQAWISVETPEPWIVRFAVDGGDYVVPPGHALPLVWEVQGDGMDPQPVVVEAKGGSAGWTTVLAGLPPKGRAAWTLPTRTGPLPALRLKVSARDGAGKRHESVREIQPWVVVDADPPRVRLVGPALWTREGPAALEAEIVDELAGVQTLQLWWRHPETGEWQALKPQSARKALTFAEKDGHHALWLSAVDRLGNASPAPAPGAAPMLDLVVDRNAPEITLLSPKGGEELEVGSLLSVSWTARDENLTEGSVGLFASRDDGATWELLKDSLPASGDLEWTLPGEPATLWLRISARDVAGHVGRALLEKPLRVRSAAALPAPPPPPVVVQPPPPPPPPPAPTLAEAPVLLGFPPSGRIVQGGKAVELRWTPPEAGGLSVRIERTEGEGWTAVGEAPAAEGRLVWQVPAMDRPGQRLRLSVLLGEKVLASSESPAFLVATKPPRLSLVVPERAPEEP